MRTHYRNVSSLVLALLGVVATCILSAGQAELRPGLRPFVPSDINEIVELGESRVSPDGKAVLLTVTTTLASGAQRHAMIGAQRAQDMRLDEVSERQHRRLCARGPNDGARMATAPRVGYGRPTVARRQLNLPHRQK